jgi:hypothetical protein
MSIRRGIREVSGGLRSGRLQQLLRISAASQVPRRRRRLTSFLRPVVAAATISVGAVVLPVGSTPTASALTTTNFSYTGGTQTWTVPSGVTSIQIDSRGAEGGGTYGGFGARVVVTVPVTPGQVLAVMVGGAPTPHTYSAGYNGGGAGNTYSSTQSGGGGGASDVRTSSALSDRIVVAGGGGGAGGLATSTDGGGGSGGTSTGQTGDAGVCIDNPGTGGTQTAGGAGGTGSYSGTPFNGAPGTLGTGGAAVHTGVCPNFCVSA